MKPNHKPLTELDMMMLRAGWNNYVPHYAPRPLDYKHVRSMAQSVRSNTAKFLRQIASYIEVHTLKNQTS